jgi:GT2 family glycosyltransferase
VQPLLTISIVSHQQAALLAPLLDDLKGISVPHEVIVTINLPEDYSALRWDHKNPYQVIVNPRPKGLSSNQNSAFQRSKGAFFCSLNPDVRLVGDPFPALLDCLSDRSIGVIAPSVTDAGGVLQESARAFPTPLSILLKAFGNTPGPLRTSDPIAYPDWVAGMFMLFPRAAFEAVQGFDERYFLYYEDVDICARMRNAGYRVAYLPSTSVIHQARFASHRQWRYLRWHLGSMARFFWGRACGSL